MKDLPTGFSGAAITIAGIVIAAAVVLVLIVVVSKLRRRRLLKRAWEKIALDEDHAHALQAKLLEHIQFFSENQRQPVSTAGFWKGRNVPRPVRTALISELIDARVVGEVAPTYSNDFLSFIGEAWKAFFCLPPKVLVLSDRDWLLMVNSRMDGRQILIERMILTVDSHDTNNSISTGGGNVLGVAQGGRDVKLKVQDVAQQNSTTDVEQLHTLLRALRLDSELAADARVAARLKTHADLLEQELEDPMSPENRQNHLDRIVGLVDKYGDAMATTIRVLGNLTQN
ncbi:hypothetical protein J7E83_02235 [Arthrobacter sp. ISL-48]|uniref:hypothetical protein n=1 Tax=Arthrobacter sp. ISL-48 TaxID=2819110 RepID=UPI001BE7D3DE|nr:hypothetical protein [Arthrobacter sp. ISL-48]MBT2530958.1 hypothetical protein [Arthrobacter sp. ISL-48]